ncbi:tetratricopeptide repeat protein [Anthocerotibacter panamensis]|uniref:tetratricopeptide repeat protein n=1 Tax=Anthocerotibacter panamensis TaxID=2857077 RepID=UPI001C4030D9|nr:tetratricopeptide repeat protein [Anthocerotibacter panamensis]
MFLAKALRVVSRGLFVLSLLAVFALSSTTAQEQRAQRKSEVSDLLNTPAPTEEEPAPIQDIGALQQQLKSTFAQVRSWVGSLELVGSGAVIDPTGLIATNDHVLQCNSALQVTLANGQTYPASVVHTDPLNDLALLQIRTKTPLPSLPLAQSPLQSSEPVYGLGQSTGFLKGTVLGIGERTVRVDTRATFGDSRGPFVNRAGALVAVLSTGASGQVNFTEGRLLKYLEQGLERVRRGARTDPSELCSVQRRAYEPFSEATQAISSGNRTQALALLAEAIRRNPDFYTAYENRAQLYMLTGNYTQALADFAQALRYNRNDLTYYQRGVVYSFQKNYPEAIRDYTEALRFNPNHLEALHNRAVCYLSLRDSTHALADLNREIALRPNEPEVYLARGAARANTQDRDGARTDWQRAAQLFKERGDTANSQKALNYLQSLR